MLSGYYEISTDLVNLSLCSFCESAIVICGIIW